MNESDPWDLLRTGQTEKGLSEMHRAYIENPSSTYIMQLGNGYLWAGCYPEAWEHFQAAIGRHPLAISDFYAMAGVAKWCLDEPREACGQWQEGLEADFQDAAGIGICLPLLLYAASALRPGVFDKVKAIGLLEQWQADPRIAEWPGPIASLLLSQTSPTELKEYCQGDDEVDTNDRIWSLDFYEAIAWFSEGRRSEFSRRMRELTDISTPTWTIPDFFLARMWSPEFFLARFEAERMEIP